MQKDARSTPEATISNKVANERRRRGKSNLGDSMEEGKELETRVEEKPSQNKIVNEQRKKEEDKLEEKKKERLKRKNRENQSVEVLAEQVPRLVTNLTSEKTK